MSKGQENAEQLAETKQTLEQSPNLDLSDLAILLNLLKASIERGTWEVTELRQVLDVYEKLDAFLQFQAKLQAAAKQNKETANDTT